MTDITNHSIPILNNIVFSPFNISSSKYNELLKLELVTKDFIRSYPNIIFMHADKAMSQ